MKVDSDFFSTKLQALQSFGFQGKVLVQALWQIPNQTNRYLWFAKSGKYDLGMNTLIDDGMKFRDIRDPKIIGADAYWTHASDGSERILFLKTKRYGKDTFKFAGVFKPDLQASILNVSAWARVSDQC